MISGIDTAMYRSENRSRRKTLGLEETGAKWSKISRTKTSQNIVYTALIGNSPLVNKRGNRDTCPATASGRKAPR